MQDGNKAIAAGAQKEPTLLERGVRLKPLQELEVIQSSRGGERWW